MSGVVAVVLAGGRGRRFAAERNKVLVDLLGHPVIEWSIRSFAAHPGIDEVLLVGHPDDLAELRSIAAGYDVRAVIAGGAERPDSERAALAELRVDIDAGAVGTVLIHDGARPIVSAALIDRVLAAAQTTGAVPVLPAPLLLNADATVLAVPAGQRLGAAQTPQGGPAAALLSAYDDAQRAGFAGTDTVSYLEQARFPVQAVHGAAETLKVTYPEDLLAAARRAVAW